MNPSRARRTAALRATPTKLPNTLCNHRAESRSLRWKGEVNRVESGRAVIACFVAAGLESANRDALDDGAAVGVPCPERR
jgi:hypothetical protein